MHLTELHLKDDVLVSVPLLLSCSVLRDFFDLDFSILGDDVLNVEFEESVEAANLLGDQTMLLKV